MLMNFFWLFQSYDVVFERGFCIWYCNTLFEPGVRKGMRKKPVHEKWFCFMKADILCENTVLKKLYIIIIDIE